MRYVLIVALIATSTLTYANNFRSATVLPQEHLCSELYRNKIAQLGKKIKRKKNWKNATDLSLSLIGFVGGVFLGAKIEYEVNKYNGDLDRYGAQDASGGAYVGMIAGPALTMHISEMIDRRVYDKKKARLLSAVANYSSVKRLLEIDLYRTGSELMNSFQLRKEQEIQEKIRRLEEQGVTGAELDRISDQLRSAILFANRSLDYPTETTLVDTMIFALSRAKAQTVEEFDQFRAEAVEVLNDNIQLCENSEFPYEFSEVTALVKNYNL